MSAITRQTGLYKLTDLPASWLRKWIQQHLTAQDRLSLFPVSRGMATAVLQHAARTRLRLTSDAAGDVQARRHVIDTLLATAPGVELAVRVVGEYDGGSEPEPCPEDVLSVWGGRVSQQVRQLTLDKVVITVDLLHNQLQLQNCSQLQTLVLAEFCGALPAPQYPEGPAQEHPRILPPTCTDLRVIIWHPEAAADIIHLAGHQLTHFTCINYLHQYPVEKLSQLTHVTVHYLDDKTMDCLMTLPKLTHVTADRFEMKQSYINKELGWEQLRLAGLLLYVEFLCALPLQHIQQVVLCGGIKCIGPDSVITEHLASCHSLQCVPRDLGLCGYPVFAIQGSGRPIASELITLCANSMTESGGLYLQDIAMSAIQQLLPSIAQLPPTVQTLRVDFSCSAGREQLTTEQQGHVWKQLVDALPQHIKELLIKYETDDKTLVTASSVVQCLKDRQKATKLAVVFLFPWSKIPAGLQALATANPQHMHFLRMKWAA